MCVRDQFSRPKRSLRPRRFLFPPYTSRAPLSHPHTRETSVGRGGGCRERRRRGFGETPYDYDLRFPPPAPLQSPSLHRALLHLRQRVGPQGVHDLLDPVHRLHHPAGRHGVHHRLAAVLPARRGGTTAGDETDEERVNDDRSLHCHHLPLRTPNTRQSWRHRPSPEPGRVSRSGRYWQQLVATRAAGPGLRPTP